MKELLLLPLRKFGRVLEGTWVYLGSLGAMAMLVGTLGMALYHTIEWRRIGGEAEYYGGVVNHGGAELPEGVAALPDELQEKPHCCIRFEYDGEGRLLGFVYLNAYGQVGCIPGSAVAAQRMVYDEQGRLLRKQNVDEKGVPAADAAGVATRLFSYDAAGNLVRRETLSADGALVVPRMAGYAVEVVTYDEKHRPVLREYQDEYGKPAINAWGESRLVYRYDDAAGVSTRENYVDDVLTENHFGYAVERREAAADAQCSTVSWLDARGNPAVNHQTGSACVCTRWKREAGLHREFVCRDAEAQEPVGVRSCAERLARYDRQGRLEWECFKAEDGLLCLHPCLGYAERVCRYGEDGGLQTEFFWDAGGHPAMCYEKRYLPASDAEPPCVLSLFCDGSTSVRPVAGGNQKTGLSTGAYALP